MIRRAARPETHFTIIRNDVLRDNRLSYRARGLLAAILSRPDNWSIRAEQLALEGNEGRAAVRTCLKELREFGYLKTTIRKNDKGHFYTEQIIFDTPQSDEAVIQPNSESWTPEDWNPVNEKSESWSPLEEPLERNEKKEHKEQTKKKSPAIKIADELFEQFYQAFPKKKDRQDAYAAWLRAVKKTDPQILIEGARRYAEAREGKDHQYTKYPATWLNKGAWLDEPDEVFLTPEQQKQKMINDAIERRNKKELGI
jgi:hypothetical protein